MSPSQVFCLYLSVAMIAAWPLTRLTTRALDRREQRRQERALRRRAAKATGDHDRLGGAA